MAFAGKSDRKETVTAAITANIWMSNERGARGAFPNDTLCYMVLDCLVRGHYKLILQNGCLTWLDPLSLVLWFGGIGSTL